MGSSADAEDGAWHDLLGWTEDAACIGLRTDLFFTPSLEHLAKAVCAGCPVTARCAEYGGLDEGVFGGMNQDERRKANNAQE